jgi:oxygen-independent coproporphyrinogen-3 oxidase
MISIAPAPETAPALRPPIAAAAPPATPPVMAPAIPPALLRAIDRPGPRYTSYPTADRFVDAFSAEDLLRALQARREGPARDTPVSLYVHLPFCESVCYYCACNKVVTRHHEQAAIYLDALEREIALVAAELGARPRVSQLHFGGGTPTFLSDAELERLMKALDAAFALDTAAEVSIEVDPRTVSAARLAHLKALGFNRLSFGVQDFDPAVQAAVHRIQPESQVRGLIEAARTLGFASTNVDLIYGLPRQTPASFARTLEQVRALRPDRIALYAYAHLPERFKAQRRIVSAELPTGEQRLAMLAAAIAGFADAGYDYVGMDHFALPEDALAVAKRAGRLHRNFQGYSTQPDCDLVALGVSAIGKIGATFSQNAKTLPEYYAALTEGRLPVVRGYALTADDRLRRDAIMALMCQGRLELDAIGAAHGIDARAAFADEIAALEPVAANGLVVLRPDGVEVTALGWYFVRSIAMVFDGHLRGDDGAARYSRIV